MSEPSRPHERSRIQRWIPRLLFPFAESIERHSRHWHMSCPCGHSRSVWEHGGIRWMASRSPRRLARCEGCGDCTMHQVRWVELEDL